MIKKFFAVERSIIFILLTSCSNCPEDWQLERDFNIDFAIYDDVSGENLLQIASRYDRDSTRIFDDKGNLVYPGPVPGDGFVVFSPLLPYEEFELGEADEHIFYLRLYENATKTSDVDTIKLNYSSIYLDDCNEKAFEFIYLYYNGELVYERENWSRIITVAFYK